MRICIVVLNWILVLYKVVQRFGVTCLFTGQYDTALLWHITDVIFKILPMQMKYRILLMGNTVEMAGG